MDGKPHSVVSLFSGAGGLDIGLERAGFHTVSAVDSDTDCLASLEANRKAKIAFDSHRHYLDGSILLHADIETLDPARLRPADAGKDWVPDLMAGGPPCQPFSSSGKMLSVGDPRGKLFEHFVRIARALRPKTVLFENVRGLVTARGANGEPGEVIESVREAFETIGYATTFALLNAADCGSAQRRVRCFMLATRCTALPAFPEPTHAEKPSGDLFGGLLRWKTSGECLTSIPSPEEGQIVRPTAVLAARLADVLPGSGLKSAGARETTRPGGHWGYRQGTFIADLTQPARTVTASASQDWIRLPDSSLRRLTLTECAALQGFPTEWQFVGPLASRFRQVGNAVPSIFGEVLGNALLEAIRGGRTRKPTSAAFPRGFASAIDYTTRENRRNGESRRAVRAELQKGGAEVRSLKGIGSANPSETDRFGESEC